MRLPFLAIVLEFIVKIAFSKGFDVLFSEMECKGKHFQGFSQIVFESF
jgi:hypothetical protein